MISSSIRQHWEDPAPGQWGTSAAYYNDYGASAVPANELALGRNFRIYESVAVELQGMFFNVLNRTFLHNPDSGNARPPCNITRTGPRSLESGASTTGLPLLLLARACSACDCFLGKVEPWNSNKQCRGRCIMHS